MMSLGSFNTARVTRSRKLRTGIRVVGLLVLGCSAASATALLYPGRGASTGTVRPEPRLEKVSLWAALAPAKEESKPAITQSIVQADGAAVASPAKAKPAVRQIPLTGGVDPTPPTPLKVIQAAVQPSPAAVQAPPAPAAIVQTPAVLASNGKAPTTCLAPGLKSVLQDVQARFGTVTLVSTTELHTDNHTKGSVRHKLHSDCMAVDFKVAGDLGAVTAYLRTRSEVAGINTYKNNGVIHIDAAQTRTIAQR
jgi:hypothetical protein